MCLSFSSRFFSRYSVLSVKKSAVWSGESLMKYSLIVRLTFLSFHFVGPFRPYFSGPGIHNFQKFSNIFFDNFIQLFVFVFLIQFWFSEIFFTSGRLGEFFSLWGMVFVILNFLKKVEMGVFCVSIFFCWICWGEKKTKVSTSQF